MVLVIESAFGPEIEQDFEFGQISVIWDRWTTVTYFLHRHGYSCKMRIDLEITSVMDNAPERAGFSVEGKQLTG